MIGFWHPALRKPPFQLRPPLRNPSRGRLAHSRSLFPFSNGPPRAPVRAKKKAQQRTPRHRFRLSGSTTSPPQVLGRNFGDGGHSPVLRLLLLLLLLARRPSPSGGRSRRLPLLTYSLALATIFSNIPPVGRTRGRRVFRRGRGEELTGEAPSPEESFMDHITHSTVAVAGRWWADGGGGGCTAAATGVPSHHLRGTGGGRGKLQRFSLVVTFDCGKRTEL